MKPIYLDHNATTPVHPDVMKAMLPYFCDEYGNASSLHHYGRKAREAVENARRKVAAMIGPCEPADIIFTAGGTESDNLAIKGAAYGLKDKGNHIITSSVEHLAVLNTCEYLQKCGFEVSYIPVDKYGIIDIDALKSAIKKETILITVMAANNDVGTIQPIEEIAAVARARGVFFHTDAVQAAGKIPLNAEKMGVSLMSLSAHKMYGPKGAGALYISKKVKLMPLLHGGHHEKGLRAGTENVAAIAGFGKACELASKNMAAEAARLSGLRDKLWEGIKNSISGVRMNGHPVQRLPNTLNVSFEAVEGESVLFNLDLEGIAASSGSACTSGSLESSHVLKAMYGDDTLAGGSVRFSVGMGNSRQQIQEVAAALKEIISRLRDVSIKRKK